MGHQLLTLLDQDPDKTQVELDDASLRSLYEALLLTRLLDASCVQLQGEGRVGFYVPSLPAAASSAGAAVALAGNDWLFPSFRDAAAFVARGGTVDQFLAQVLGSEDRPHHQRRHEAADQPEDHERRKLDVERQRVNRQNEFRHVAHEQA